MDVGTVFIEGFTATRVEIEGANAAPIVGTNKSVARL